MSQCPKCNNPVDDSAKFCPVCGSAINVNGAGEGAGVSETGSGSNSYGLEPSSLSSDSGSNGSDSSSYSSGSSPYNSGSSPYSSGSGSYGYSNGGRLQTSSSGFKFAKIGLILGIVSNVLAYIPIFLIAGMNSGVAIVFLILTIGAGVAGIILSVKGKNQIRQETGRNSAVAIVGLVLSIVGIIGGAFIMIYAAALLSLVNSTYYYY